MQLILTLSESSKEPMYVQVYDSIRRSIEEGRLRAGERLPSTREVADVSGISRFTIIRSYELLTAQGFIETITGSGTFVKHNVTGLTHPRDPVSIKHYEPIEPARLSTFGQRLVTEDVGPMDAELFDQLNYGAPGIEDLPLKAWRDVINKCARFQDKTLFQYVSDPMGYPHLREAITDYLSRARSTKSTPDHMAIFSGAQSALDMVCRVLLNPGDFVVVENPGSMFPRRTFKAHGVKLLPISVDKQGLVVNELYGINSKIKLVYITPSHQDPTGVVMSLSRRMELLEWAEKTGAFIVEDDYDSEYNYGEKPVQSLQGLDEHGTVIYLSSFWKVLFPIVRIGFLILPLGLIDAMRLAKSAVERDLPLLEHSALTEFVNGGLLERQIKRLRNQYSKKRAALLHVLTRRFKQLVTIGGVSAGMHLVITFDERFKEEDISTCAREAGVPMVSSKNHYLEHPRSHEYIIDFAHSDEATLCDVIERFANSLTKTLP